MKNTPVKRVSTSFLKVVILLIGLVTLAALIWFPQAEGRAKGLDLLSIYLDPFILYIYLASIPFFAALFQALKLLGFIEKNKIFSHQAVESIRNIKFCAVIIVCSLVVAMSWVRLTSGNDDPAGAIAVGTVMVFAATVIATAAAVLQKVLQAAVDLKSENDLTV
jgi:multisubunit Na+/H+ antiporter MnhF subunit